MNRVRISTSFIVLWFWSCLTLAAATTQALSGDVQMAPANGEYGSLAFGQRVETGATIKTASTGRVVLRFDDGQMVSIAESSLFVINNYKFNAHKPEEAIFSLAW